MISQIQKNEIVKILGTNYLKIIKEYLLENDILSRGEREYSDRSISRILNGEYENVDVESAIIDLWEDRLYALKEEEARKKRLLSESQELSAQ